MLNVSSGDCLASPLINLEYDAGIQVAPSSQVGHSLPVYVRPIEAALTNPWREVAVTLSPSKKASKLRPYDHAAPISPMRDRDLNELSGLFDRKDILDVEQDVNRCLIQLFPEPCWEEKEGNFLKEPL
jgi:hypothetical protein